ncbi:hypothetical protein OG948_59645 (plasmid) [Embleya sp. NBC_00888]|uniref:hypothetical protein n=1 Tax=Embleya sp. NBC_00888 TaxID=2975960 RepID=UPI002F91B9EF|nr:hypothetical protein OG948_59645 [Embleya sp. NBC_00888]
MRDTLFRALVIERGWNRYDTFDIKFSLARDALAGREREPDLHRVTLSKRTFERWMSGDVRSVPQIGTRRILQHMLGVPATALFGPAPFPRAHDPHAHPETRTVATALIDAAQAGIDDIVDRYESHGPGHMVGEARLLWRMTDALARTNAHGRLAPDRARLAARSAGLLAYMAVNLGALTAAEAWSRRALTIADDVGDTETCIWIWGTRSLGFYYAGRYADADTAAAAGIALGPAHPQAVRLLANGRARALARLGEHRRATRAIGRALDLTDRQVELPDGVSPCIAFTPYSPARTLANAVTAHLSLGRTADVLRHANRIEDLVTRSDSDWTRALVDLDVATALLRRRPPDVEHAMTLGLRALEHGGPTPIRSVWIRAHELRDEAEPWSGHDCVLRYAHALATRTLPPASLTADLGNPRDPSPISTRKTAP